VSRGVGTTARKNKLAKLAKKFSKDIAFFGKFFWSSKKDTFYLPFANFHHKILKEIAEGYKAILIVSAPRGFAKTKLVGVLTVLWKMFIDKREYCILISHTDKKSKQSLRDIKKCMHSPLFRKMFKWEKGNIWRQDIIEVKIGNRSFLIEAKSTGTQIFGASEGKARPDLFILDDIVDLKIAKSAERTDAVAHWFNMELIPAVSTIDSEYGRPGQIIYIDTFKDQDCMLARAVEWSKKESNVKAMIFPALDKDDTMAEYPYGMSIWEEKESTQQLYEKMASFKARGAYDSWLTQYMLDTTAVRSLKFREVNLTKLDPKDVKENLKKGRYKIVIIVDMAYSEKTWADYSGITVCGHLYDKDSNISSLDFLEALKGKWSPEVLFNILHDLKEKYNKWLEGIYAETLQWKYINAFFLQRSVITGNDIEVFPMNRPAKYYAQDKVGRIGMLVPYYTCGQMRVLVENCQPLLSQMWSFAGKKDQKDDDVLDSAAHHVFFMEESRVQLMESKEVPYDPFNAKQHIERVLAQQAMLEDEEYTEDYEDEYMYDTYF
jgi:hypothetical protein